MAFPASPGYGNLPRGNWSPQIFSQKVLKFLRAVTVADEITNTEFEGEINQKGDSVRILKEPEITTFDYTRGYVPSPQDIDDEDVTMTIDQAKGYLFREDDIEKRQAHVSFSQMAVGGAAYALNKAYETDILTQMIAGAGSAAEIGVSGTEKTVGFSAADFTPLDILNRLARFLDDNNVPDDGGRFMVATPQYYEWLSRESSKFVNAEQMGDPESVVKRRKMGAMTPIQGLTCYKSTLLPLNANSKPVILVGHRQATATAKNLLSAEVLRDQTTFADLYRGLMVWGRKVLRPEALFVAHVNFVA